MRARIPSACGSVGLRSQRSRIRRSEGFTSNTLATYAMSLRRRTLIKIQKRDTSVGDRNERWIIVLVLAAAGLVLAAPVVGRLGAAALADVVMGAAAAAGLAAWGLAGVATV